MGILKRSAMAVAAIGAAGAIVAGGTIPALAATTSGVRYAAVQDTTVGPNVTAECAATVLSAAVSTGNPAYVSAMVTNTSAYACTGWLQSSMNGGAWKDVSEKVRVPGGQGLNNEAWYKSANYYAGPGTRVRACIEVQFQIPAANCSSPVSLAKSTATPASDGTPVYYAQRQQPAWAPGPGGQCFAFLSSSTKSKASTSHVNLTLQGNLLVRTCTGWLESSTNNGKTWEQATPTYSMNSSRVEYAFSSAVADGTGHLVRACAQLNTAKKCTAAW